MISFRIRKKYFDAIVSGKKTIEFRKDSEFWRKRLHCADIAVFICGKKVHRRKITAVITIPTPKWFSDQGKKDVNTTTCLAFYLGSVVEKKRGLDS